MMSRSHLYRAGGPSRPLLSLVLAAVWLGGGSLVLLATGPDIVGGLPLHGPAAGLLERTFALLAGGAVLVGIAIIATETAVGRTPTRGLRLAGAVLLLLAGGWGVTGGAGRLLRPGTPAIAEAATGDTAVPAESRTLAVQRLLWSSTALLGAVLVVGGSLAGRGAERGL